MQEIEMVGTGGTSLGKFTRTKLAGRLTDPDDAGTMRVLAVDGTQYGTVKPDSCMDHVLHEGVFTAHVATDWEYGLAANHCRLIDAVTAIMGRPGYGYSRYRIVTVPDPFAGIPNARDEDNRPF